MKDNPAAARMPRGPVVFGDIHKFLANYPGRRPVDFALSYAKQGWPVLPLHAPEFLLDLNTMVCSCRQPCLRPAKHLRADIELDDATCDLSVISSWWAKWPLANIGLATGVAFDVLDFELPAAVPSLHRLKATDEDVAGPAAYTGTGIHHYVLPSGLRSRKQLLAGIDYHGVGGFVVAAPSVHISGVMYHWSDEGQPESAITAAPLWLNALLHPSTSGEVR